MSEEPPKQQELPGRLDRDDMSRKWNNIWELRSDQGIGELPVEPDSYIPLVGEEAKEAAAAAKRVLEDLESKKSK